jgi:hypothetical protein
LAIRDEEKQREKVILALLQTFHGSIGSMPCSSRPTSGMLTYEERHLSPFQAEPTHFFFDELNRKVPIGK